MEKLSYQYNELTAWKIAGHTVVCCRLSGVCNGFNKEYSQFYNLVCDLPMNIYIHSLQCVDVLNEMEPCEMVFRFDKLQEKGVAPFLCEATPRVKDFLDMLGVSSLYKVFPNRLDIINLVIPQSPLTDESELAKYQIFYQKPFSLQDFQTLKARLESA